MRRASPELLQWIGLFAAPAAWLVQLGVGFGATVAACSAGGSGLELARWEVAITVVTAAVALGGQWAAVSAWRSTRRGEPGAPAAAGRIHFFADAALLSNTLFVVLILLGGITAAHLAPCQQA